MADLQGARDFALSLPGTIEQPHFDMSSFRVHGKIFATVPPGQDVLHVFVQEAEVRACVAEDPSAFAPLLWGRRVSGLRLSLAAVSADRLAELLEEAWRRKAPRRLVADYEQGRG